MLDTELRKPNLTAVFWIGRESCGMSSFFFRQGLLADCNEELNERGLKIVSKLRRLNRVVRLAACAQILPMDVVCFREWERLLEGQQEHLLEDRMIAATARIHGLTAATRNYADFAQLDVALVNPVRGHG